MRRKHPPFTRSAFKTKYDGRYGILSMPGWWVSLWFVILRPISLSDFFDDNVQFLCIIEIPKNEQVGMVADDDVSTPLH